MSPSGSGRRPPSVKLALFDEQHKSPFGERAMTLDEASGSWSVQGQRSCRQHYRYDIRVYHPVSRKLESIR